MRVLYKLQDTPRKTLRDFNVVRLRDGEVESHLVGMGNMNRMCQVFSSSKQVLQLLIW